MAFVQNLEKLLQSRIENKCFKFIFMQVKIKRMYVQWIKYESDKHNAIENHVKLQKVIRKFL